MKQVYTQQEENRTPSVRAHLKAWVLFIGFLVWLLAAKETFGQPANGSAAQSVACRPLITGVPADLVVAAGTNCQAVVSWVAPKAASHCNLVSFTADKAPGTAFSLGTQKITYTATDEAGNVARASFLVTVEDRIAPLVAVQPATISLNAKGKATLLLADVRVSSTDNCGVLAEVLSRTTFDSSHVGTNPVTLAVTDNNGNVTQKTVMVTVQDNPGPAVVARPLTGQPDTSGLVSLPEVWVGSTGN